MNSLTMELRLRVKYETEDGRIPVDFICHSLLESLVQHAVDNGLLTGETDLIVDNYRFDIEIV